MPRTVLINYTGRKGGGSLDAICTAEGFIENNIDVIAIISSYAENLEQWKKLPLKKLVIIRTYTDKISFVFSTLIFFLFKRYEITKLLKDVTIDYIYCPMVTLWTSLINSLFKNIPTFCVDHDPEPHIGDKDFRILERSYKTSDVIFVHTKKFVDFVKNKYKKPCFYIPLGRHDIYKDCPNKKKIIAYDENRQNFLFFGRISQYKGLDVLYEAYQKLESENDNVSLIIAGNGDFTPYSDRYKTLKYCQILNQWIADEELESLFLCSHLICVLPYVEATQSGVVLVAMDYGIPVIVTRTGGLVEQVEDDKTGLVVSPGNAEELYAAMKRLSEDKILYTSISQNEKAYIDSLSWKVTMKMVDNYYSNFKR